MKESLKIKYISNSRLSGYTSFEEYRRNLIISKNSYIPLAVLEIALRNALDSYLSSKIGFEWHLDSSFLTQGAMIKVQEAKDIIDKRKEACTKEKIIAELNFGFWVNLFQRPYQDHLRIKELKLIFPYMPSKATMLVNREEVYKKLDHIRNFRNRIFHYEKVINKDHFSDILNEIHFMLNMFDAELAEFAMELNNDK